MSIIGHIREIDWGYWLTHPLITLPVSTVILLIANHYVTNLILRIWVAVIIIIGICMFILWWEGELLSTLRWELTGRDKNPRRDK